jgi:hypothetical protein
MERAIAAEGGDNPYPDWDALRLEDEDEATALVFTISDRAGRVVRRIVAPHEQGLHRVSWDLRYPAPHPVDLAEDGFRAPWAATPQGPLVLPGQYSVTIEAHEQGAHRKLIEGRPFTVRALDLTPETTKDRPALLEFQLLAAELYRSVSGAVLVADDFNSRLEALDRALLRLPNEASGLHDRLLAARADLAELERLLSGDRTIQSRREAVPWSLERRADSLLDNWNSQSPETGTARKAYDIALAEYARVSRLISELETVIRDIELDMYDAGAPWTPGRRSN